MGCRGEARSVDTVHLLPSSAVAGKQPEVFSNGMQDLLCEHLKKLSKVPQQKISLAEASFLLYHRVGNNLPRYN